MQKLEPHNQIEVTEEVIKKILDTYSIFDFSFKPINEGIANTSLIIESTDRKYVLRIYAQNRKSNEGIFFEIEFQDYLRSKDIPIPLIYKNVQGDELNVLEIDGKDWQTILMDFVEGQSVTTKPSPKLIAELANLQAKMHLLGIEFAKNVKKTKKLWVDLHDELASKVENTTVGGQEVLDLINRIKSYRYRLNPELPCGYNHLDIDFDGNVLTKNDKVTGIVDFDDLMYSPAIVCLGYSLWNILDDEGEDAMRYYLSEYEKIRPLTFLEKEALPNVIFFRNYVMVIIRLLLWDDSTPIEDITNLIRLEKEIPKIVF